MRAIVLACWISAVAAACEMPTGPEYAVEISLADSVVARFGPGEVNLIIPVRLKNLDDRTVFYEFCGHALQRREGSGWRFMPLPQCQTSGSSFALSKGESYQFTFRIKASLPSEEWPAVGAAGEYRVILWLTSVPRNTSGIPPQPLAPSSRTSPTFSVTELLNAI